MIENLKKFIAKLLSNDKLKEDFKSVANKNSFKEIYQFALKNSEGGFTKEEFENYISKLAGEVEYAKDKIIKDENLESISGGVNLPGKEFWENVNQIVERTDEMKDMTGSTNGEKAINYIYNKELELQKQKNKGETIQAAMGAISGVTNLISTLGSLIIGIKNVKHENELRKSKASSRELQRLQLLEELHRLKEEYENA